MLAPPLRLLYNLRPPLRLLYNLRPPLPPPLHAIRPAMTTYNEQNEWMVWVCSFCLESTYLIKNHNGRNHLNTL